ncbi:hypothetical protein D3C73_459240 [compost metagenome]
MCLFSGLFADFAPALEPFALLALIILHNRALGEKRNEGYSADFGTFLNHRLQLVPLRQTLGHRDLDPRLMRHIQQLHNIGGHFTGFNPGNLHQRLPGDSVADNQLVPGLTAHDLGDMTGILSANHYRVRLKLLRCYKITLHILIILSLIQH